MLKMTPSEIQAALSAGTPIQDVAARLGITTESVRKRLYRAGLAIPATQGGYPRGRRRNPTANWSPLRLRLTAYLDANYQRGVVTREALAVAIGVDARSLRRWLAGEDVPTVASQLALSGWLLDRDKIDRKAARKLRSV